MKVWDRLVRVLHGGLIVALASAWLSDEASLRLHEWAGYAALTIVAVRCGWGLIGSCYARFVQFVRPPRALGRYALSLLARREPRHVGHNPIGGWMVCLLLAMVALVGATGWLYTLDAFWGLAWLEWLHRTLAWALLALVAVHVGGVAFMSWRHRENLVGAMLHGRKREPRGDDVT